MKKHLCLLIMWLPLLTMAQTTNENNSGGIKWTSGLSWEQVKAKAKAENKYIFLDIYATWCGPCKDMDKNVYVDDSVGVFFNEKFISVKVQVDKTKNDNEQVKNWYNDAAMIARQYYIEAFPSFVFLSPDGTTTEKERGYKTTKELVTIGKGAIQTGKKYNDEYAKYDSLMADFRKGIVHYDQLPDMIKAATKIDTGSRAELMQLYKEHVSSLKPKDRYAKKHIQFWSSLNLGLNSPLFRFFVEDGKTIDKVMANNSYSADMIDKIIQSEIVVPFLIDQNTRKEIPMAGMIMTGPGFKGDSTEADWQKLYKTIKEKFNDKISKRNVLTARIEWYLRHSNIEKYHRYKLLYLDTYSPDLATISNDGSITSSHFIINAGAWNAFVNVTDKKVLNGYVKWMRKVVQAKPERDSYLDTYANLLYKTGRKKEAIVWEEKAMLLGGRIADECKMTLDKMKKGEPISPGVVEWDGINTVNWDGVIFSKIVSVSDTAGNPVSTVKVLNSRSGELKYSNDKGRLKMEVSLGDKLSFSSEQYQMQEIVIGKDTGTLYITLKPVKKTY